MNISRTSRASQMQRDIDAMNIETVRAGAFSSGSDASQEASASRSHREEAIRLFELAQAEKKKRRNIYCNVGMDNAAWREGVKDLEAQLKRGEPLFHDRGSY